MIVSQEHALAQVSYLMYSLEQLPMMQAWSEGREYAVLDWPIGTVEACFRPEAIELAVNQTGSSKILQVLACMYAGFSRRWKARTVQ
jgi:hypothetical protein